MPKNRVEVGGYAMFISSKCMIVCNYFTDSKIFCSGPATAIEITKLEIRTPMTAALVDKARS